MIATSWMSKSARISLIDDIGIVASIAGDHDYVTAVFDAEPMGRFDYVIMIDFKCNDLETIFLIARAILVELLHFNGNSFSWALILDADLMSAA